MSKLINSKGDSLTKSAEIVKEVQSFYEKLYEKKSVENCVIYYEVCTVCVRQVIVPHGVTL